MPPKTEPESWADYYDTDYNLPRIHEHLTNLAPFVARCRRVFGGTRILEVGPGTGIISIYFRQLGLDVTAVDYDGGIVRRCRALDARFGAGCRFLQGDMFHLPFGDGAFDACFHQGLMEHFDPPEILAGLQEQIRVARRIIFTVPTVRWRGGTRGDERMWPARKWRDLLAPFRVVETFGGAFEGLPARTLNFVDGRVVRGRFPGLTAALALARAGEIGFVIERH